MWSFHFCKGERKAFGIVNTKLCKVSAAGGEAGGEGAAWGLEGRLILDQRLTMGHLGNKKQMEKVLSR